MRRINKSYLNLKASLENEELSGEEDRRRPAAAVEPTEAPIESPAVPEAVVDAASPTDTAPTEVVTPEVVVTTAVAEVPAVSAAATDAIVEEPVAPVEGAVVPAEDAPVEGATSGEEDRRPASEPAAAEPAAEPVAEEPAVEPAAEPAAEPTAEPAAEPVVPAEEPVVDTPAVEPTAEPVVEPAVEPAAEPAAEPTAEPVVEEPAVDPVVEPAIEPAAEPAAEPLAEPAAEPVTEPAVEPTAEPTRPTAQAVETAPGTTAEAVQAAASAAANSLANADLPADSKVVVVVVEPVVSEAEQNELADSGELIEGDVVDAERVAMEAEEVIAEIEIVADASDELTALVEVAEDQADNGGLSDDAAKILTIATEAIYTRLKLSGHNGIPSLESFQGKYSRVGATTISVEDINGKLKSFGNALVEGAKKILEFISKFFQSVFTATGRLEARAKKIKSLAAGFKGNGSASLESPALFAKLVVGNTVPSNFAAGMVAVNDFVQEATSGVRSEGVMKLAEMTKKARDQGQWFSGVTPEDMDKFVELFFGQAHKVVTEALTLRTLSATNSQRAIDFGAPESPEGTDLKASAIFPGNTIIWAHVPRDGGHLDELQIGRAQYGEKVAPKAIPNLSGAEISKIADQALRFVELKRQFDASFKEVKDAMQLVTNIANFNSGATGAAKAMDSGEGFRAFGMFFRKMFRVTSALSNGIQRYALADALRVHNAALDYAQTALASATKEGKAQAKLAAA